MGAISGLNSEHLCVYVDVPNKLPNLVIVSAFLLFWLVLEDLLRS